MTNTDIVALIAIIVSGTISVVSIISSILINRANILAKRHEMTFSEQIKAFSSIVEQVTDIEYQRNNLRDLPLVDYELITKQIQEIDDKLSKLTKSTVGFSIFLPPYISKKIGEYIHTVSVTIVSQMPLEKQVEKVASCKPDIQFIHEMRAFIGVKR